MKAVAFALLLLIALRLYNGDWMTVAVDTLALLIAWIAVRFLIGFVIGFGRDFQQGYREAREVREWSI